MVESCSDKCYWRLEGNNIDSSKNLFGKLTNLDIRVITNKSTAGMPGRGVVKDGERFPGGFLRWIATVQLRVSMLIANGATILSAN